MMIENKPYIQTRQNMKHNSMAASGVGLLIFSDDVIHDGSSGMNSEVSKNIYQLTNGEMCHN